MTVKQREILRLANNIGLHGIYNEERKMLDIHKDDTLLGSINEQGFIFEDPKQKLSGEFDSASEALQDIASQVRFYVGLYEKAPQLPFNDVSDYRMLSEYGDIVFAAKDNDQHGFMFSTWSVYSGRTAVTHGHYTPSYEEAREDFATRSMLIDDRRLFSKEESANIIKCIGYTLENHENLTYKEEEQLKDLQSKICSAYPEINDENPTFDQDEDAAPIMSL